MCPFVNLHYASARSMSPFYLSGGINSHFFCEIVLFRHSGGLVLSFGQLGIEMAAEIPISPDACGECHIEACQSHRGSLDRGDQL